MARFDLPFTLNSIIAVSETQATVELDSIERDEERPTPEDSQNSMGEERCFREHREGCESEGEEQYEQSHQQQQKPISCDTLELPIKSLHDYLDEFQNQPAQEIQRDNMTKETQDDTKSLSLSTNSKVKGAMDPDLPTKRKTSQPIITDYFDIPRWAPSALKTRKTPNEIAIEYWLRQLPNPTSPMALSPVESHSSNSSLCSRASALIREPSFLEQPRVTCPAQSLSNASTKTTSKRAPRQD